MELDKIPTWAWAAGGAVVVLALVQSRSSGGSGATVTTVGPVPNANASADLAARVAGFDKLTGFATNVVSTDAALAQTTAQLNAQTIATTLQARNALDVAQINAQTETARIAAAQQASATQGANTLAASRSQTKGNVITGIVQTVGSVVGSLFKGVFK